MSVPGDDGPSSDESREGRRDGGPLPADEDASVGDWIHAFRTADSGWLMITREIATSAGAVLLVGLLLFAVSGVWPPMVAIESGSMEPHMYKGDLVFIIEEHRFSPDETFTDTGIVTHELGQRTGYHSFHQPGDVIVYQAYGESGTPIIHRARFWVNDSENWYDRADESYIHSSNCRELPNCPAPHAGFITKGDNNDYYDQVSGISDPVKPTWITGKARYRIPWLGWIRLQFANVLAGSAQVGELAGSISVAPVDSGSSLTPGSPVGPDNSVGSISRVSYGNPVGPGGPVEPIDSDAPSADSNTPSRDFNAPSGDSSGHSGDSSVPSSGFGGPTGIATAAV